MKIHHQAGARNERHPRTYRTAGVAFVTAVLATALLTVSPNTGIPTASAADGDAQPQLTSKTALPSTATAGQLITYSINYNCSNSNNEPPVDGCTGAVFNDPIPKFTNIFGELMPLEFVSVSSSGVWPNLVVNTADPANPFVTGTAATWAPGVSGAIQITARVPHGMVPPGNQPVSNTATVKDPIAPISTSPTATTTISGTAPDWTVSKLGPSSTRMNRDYQWVVSVCGPTDSSLWPLYDIVDTLPPGFQYVSSDFGGAYLDDPGATPVNTTSDGGGTVTWHFDAANRPPLGSNGCFRTHITGRYPTGYVAPTTPDADDDNVADAVKVNSVTGTGRNTPAGPATSIGTATWPNTLLGAVLGTVGTDKQLTDTAGTNNFYVTTADTGRFNLSAAIDSDFPVDSLILSDGRWTFASGATNTSGTGMPPSFTATSVVPGTWNSGITATIEGSNDNFATAGTVIAANVASGASAITLAPTFRSIRWVWAGAVDSGYVPADFSATGQQIVGTFGTPQNTFGLYTNVSSVTIRRSADPVSVTEDNDQYILEPALPLPFIAKSVSNGSRRPGQTATYTISIRNDADATGPLTNPTVSDCVPASFIVQGTPSATAPWLVGPTPSCGPGQTAIGYTYNGTLLPGQTSPTITYTVMVASSTPGPIAPFGNYSNTATIHPAGGGSFDHCANTNPVCGSTAVVNVPPTIELASRKCVSGDLDNGVFRPSPGCSTDPGGNVVAAQTVPGGVMTWELSLQNTGNTAANNVAFVDIFPHVGDTAVISATAGVLNQRRSEFTPFLASPIIAPTGWTVSYSTSARPCRPEVGGVNSPGGNCDAPNWVVNPSIVDLATFRSVKFTFAGTLAIGATASFSWDMRAPVTDPTFDKGGTDAADQYEFIADCTAQTPSGDATHCPRAVNSFAYGADATGLPQGTPQPGRLFAEPPQVEVRVVAPPGSNSIGDRVWFDRNFDGIQAADTSASGEPGIAGAYVELWSENGTEALFTTFTDVNGNYLFTNGGAGLANGSYFVRFYPRAGYYVPPRDRTGGAVDAGAPPGAGTNTDDDSDVPQAPTGTSVGAGGSPAGPYHDTVAITLGNNPNSTEPTIGEVDITWDMGLWRALPAIQVDKVTKDTAWPDAQAGDGVAIIQNRPVTWIYTVTNTGNTRLQDVGLVDDGGPSAEFTVSDCSIVSEGTNAAGVVAQPSSATAPMALNRGAVIRCTATGTAGRINYANNATVTGTPVTDGGQPIVPGPSGTPVVPPTVTHADPSRYVSGKYDLALAKTVGTLDLATGNVTFTIVVANEGTVASGPYTVTDVLPAGVSVISTVPPVSSSVGDAATGLTLTWVDPNLTPAATDTFTINAHVDDYLSKPFRNYAEISADSSEMVVTGGVVTTTSDADSTPNAEIADDNIGNDISVGNGYGPIGTPDVRVDNANIAEAGSAFPVPAESGDDPLDGEDDADIADIDPAIDYDLALAKQGPATSVPVGASPTFTVRVYNQGNVPSGPVTVRDQLPAGLSFAPAPSSAGCVPDTGNQIVCTLASIPVGGSTLLTVATTVDLVTGGTTPDYSTAPWTNWAEIDSDSADLLYGTTDRDSEPEIDDSNGVIGGVGDPYVGVPTAGPTYVPPTGLDEDDNDDAIANAGALYDLALIKTANATAMTQDANAGITYTITVVNQGTLASGPYAVTDTLPDGVSFVSASDGGLPDPDPTATLATVTWAGVDLAAGETKTYTLAVTVDDVTLRPFRNTAEISADSSVELYGIFDVDSTPDLETTNDNAGNGVVDGSGYGLIGAPAVGGVDNLTTADAGNGNDGEDDADIADVNLPLSVGYDLALAKVVDVPITAYDGTITYTVTLQNQGVLDSREFVVTDTVPEGLVVTDAGPGGVYDPDAGTVTWTIANLEAGATTTRMMTATVADITQRPFRNHAEITADSANHYSVDGDVVADIDSAPNDDATDYGPIGAVGPIDNTGPLAVNQAGVGADLQDDADIADVDVPVDYDLALIKTGPASMDPLGTATFTVTVVNQGNVPSGTYTVTDLVPAGMAATAADNGGTFADPTVAVEWADLPSLDPGAAATLTVTMRIIDVTERPFRNIAEITADSAGDYSTLGQTITDRDSTPGDDDSTPVDSDDAAIDNSTIGQAGAGDDAGFDDEDVADVTTDVVYDLALAKTLDQPGITYDGTAIFTVTVQNQGNVPSGPITVTDVVPPGLTVGAISDGGTLAGSTITWNLDLDVGETSDLTVAVTISDLTERPYVNSAEIATDSAAGYSTVDDIVADADSVPADEATNSVDNAAINEAGVGGDADFDDEDIASLDVPIVYDLALVKRLPGGQNYKQGNIVRFEIVVRNQGNVPSGPYSVHDDIPAGMTFTTATNGGSAAGDTVRWIDLPSLAPGATLVLSVDVRMDDVERPAYVNVAEIDTDSAGTYSTPGQPVHDIDSTPDDDSLNDALVETDDIDAFFPGDEDDHDTATIPVTQVVIDNLAPPPPPTTAPPGTTPSGPLPSTGSDTLDLALLATATLGLGLGLRALRRRPARRALPQ